jgi:hypothetical protein
LPVFWCSCGDLCRLGHCLLEWAVLSLTSLFLLYLLFLSRLVFVV